MFLEHAQTPSIVEPVSQFLVAFHPFWFQKLTSIQSSMRFRGNLLASNCHTNADSGDGLRFRVLGRASPKGGRPVGRQAGPQKWPRSQGVPPYFIKGGDPLETRPFMWECVSSLNLDEHRNPAFCKHKKINSKMLENKTRFCISPARPATRKFIFLLINICLKNACVKNLDDI